jgi:hypothetical protein
MRPYLVLTAVALMAVAAFAQQPFPHPGPCVYGCGPYVPLITTPEISFQQASPNPVGATNATTGLIAGATNSTLSQMDGSTSSVYTAPVWSGGGDAPLTSDVRLYPESIGREGRIMHSPIMQSDHTREEPGPRQEARAGWTYFSGREHTGNPATEARANGSKGSVKAGHVYTNDDITRQNDSNGDVKYDDKKEKIQ